LISSSGLVKLFFPDLGRASQCGLHIIDSANNKANLF
jgi:hypothetical protein